MLKMPILGIDVPNMGMIHPLSKVSINSAAIT